MVKKILLSITCGVVAVSMCACASGTAVLNQAQDVVTDNVGEIENYLPAELVEIFTAGDTQQAEALPEETEAAVEISDTEEASAAEIAEAPAEEVTAAEEAPAVEIAEEPVAEIAEETTVAEEAPVVEIAEEEPAAEITEETSVAEEAPSSEVETAAEEETKLLLNDDAEDETTAVAAAEEESKEDSLIAAKEEETKEDSLIAEKEEETKEDSLIAEKEEETKEDSLIAEKEEETLIAEPEKEEVKETVIFLDKGTAKVNGDEVKDNASADVYISNDILYYEDKDSYTGGNPYGDGILTDKHTAEEAAKNPVLNITKAGTYRLGGDWEGQVRVDLGEGAKTDKNAKVVLILDGAKIECTVAPAILFTNVYEAYAEDSLPQNYADPADAAQTITDADEEETTVIAPAEEETKENPFITDKEEETDENPFITDKEETKEDSSITDKEEETEEDEMASFFEDLFNSMNEDDAKDSQEAQKPELENVITPEEMEGLLEFFDMLMQYENGGEEGAFPFGELFSDEAFIGAEEPDSTEEKPDVTEEPLIAEQAPTIQEIACMLSAEDAGAVICIADGEESKLFGSHVAEIYKDSKEGGRLAKQDGAISSEVSLGITSEEEMDGSLSIVADKEGIESGRHLIVDKGHLDILSKDDGINANEEGVSIAAINGGILHIYAGTETEGDAIDSNGWIVCNGANLIASANPASDSAFDADHATYIEGGVVFGFGSSKDLASEDSSAATMNLRFAEPQSVQDDIVLKDKSGKTLFELKASDDEMLSVLEREYTGLVFSVPELEEGETYFLYIGNKQMSYAGIEKTADPFGPQAPAAPVTEPEEETKSVFGPEQETAAAEEAKEDAKDAVSQKEEIGGASEEEAKDAVSQKEETGGVSEEDAKEDLDALSEYEDLFEYFGISMDEVEDYLTEEAAPADNNASTAPADNSASTAPADNNASTEPADDDIFGFGGMGPFGGSKPEKPEEPLVNPFGTEAPDDFLDGQQAPAGELTVTFTLDKTVVTFLGVRPMNSEAAADEKDAAGSVAETETSAPAEEETTVVSGTETTGEKEPAVEDEEETTAATGLEKETAAEEEKENEDAEDVKDGAQSSDPKDAGLDEDVKIGIAPGKDRSGSISLPFAISQQIGGTELTPEIGNAEDDLYLFYQMTNVRALK